MLDESDGSDWVSRRDRRIRRPVDTLGFHTPDGIPYLAPEVQLFYKATNPCPKDEADFAAMLPLLTADQRQWLHGSLLLTCGPHPWQSRLVARPPDRTPGREAATAPGWTR